MKRFGVLGSGEVGTTLAAGLKKHGYEVRIASRSPQKLAAFAAETGIAAGTFDEVAAWAEGLVLAVNGAACTEVLTQAGVGNLRGKLVIDVTNPMTDAPPVDGVIPFFTGPNDSLLERTQAAFPDARLVKAFNSVGSSKMVNPSYAGGKPTMFYCGNDVEAKAVVARILEQFGWEPADMGTAVGARAVEPLAQLWCIPGFRDNRWGHAFKVLWP